MDYNATRPVFEQGLRAPEQLAVAADGVELRYAELTRRARRIAATLRERGFGRGARVGILGSRSLVAVEAVLGVAWAGAAYVPLGLKWPAERRAAVLELCALDAIIVDRNGYALLTAALIAATKLLIVPDDDAARRWDDAGTPIASLESVRDPDDFAEPVPMTPEDLAYIIFTSGTTGVPKGVMVPASALAAYLAALGRRKTMMPGDRASQFTELTFDPSVGEIFLPWYSGASLHVVPPVAQMSPARFIRERQLTIWGSAPAAIAWMRDTRSLRPDAFPSLRYSSFGGEPLPLPSLRAWQTAAPNSVVDNLYGPTEATVDCAGQRIEAGATPILTPGRDIVAIGAPHPGTRLAVLGSDLRRVEGGATGELAIAGSQLTLGYLGAPHLTAKSFPTIDGERWYLTGDIAMQDEDGVFHCFGRIDNQIKIHGHRVELEDVEAHLRRVAGTDHVAAVAWPTARGVAEAIVGFVAGGDAAVDRIREMLRSRLPAYMVPAVIHAIDVLPLNANGKLDRAALIAWLERRAGNSDAGIAL